MLDAQHDQAMGLRRIFGRDTLQIMSVAGSVEHAPTAVTLNLAAALARLGHRLLVLDLAKGEAAMALGLKARYELSHVLDGDKRMSEVLLSSADGFSVLPSSRGLLRLADDGADWRPALQALLPAQAGFKVWLVNGVAPPIPENNSESPLMVIALTRDSITQAYAQIKALARSQGQRDFRVVIDRADSEHAAREAFTSIAETSRRFLSARLDYCGFLPRDEGASVTRSAAARVPLADARSPRGHAFARLAEAVAAAIPVDLTSFALN